MHVDKTVGTFVVIGIFVLGWLCGAVAVLISSHEGGRHWMNHDGDKMMKSAEMYGDATVTQ